MTEKSNRDDSDKQEDLLQRFLNEITMNFEQYEIPVTDQDVYEKKVMDAESLQQILDVIFEMFQKLMKAVKSYKAKDVKSPVDIEEKNHNTEEYSNQEKLVQKYEAEIRNHIRIEQQQKIYTESILIHFKNPYFRT